MAVKRLALPARRYAEAGDIAGFAEARLVMPPPPRELAGHEQKQGQAGFDLGAVRGHPVRPFGRRDGGRHVTAPSQAFGLTEMGIGVGRRDDRAESEITLRPVDIVAAKGHVA